MNLIPASEYPKVPGLRKRLVAQFRLGRKINVEEFRMNKALLKEISAKKKSPPKHKKGGEVFLHI